MFLRFSKINIIVIDMSKRSIGIYLFFILSMLFCFSSSINAYSFVSVPPIGTFVRGQNIVWTITINTDGAVVNSAQTGLTYDASLLRYITATAGATINSLVADTTTYGAGKVLFTGTNNAGYNGTGVFATIVFNIIAESSGSTEICTLWMPTPTGTPVPTSTYPTPTPAPTLPPHPTTLPQTGTTESRNMAVVFAILLLSATGGVFYLSQKQKYSYPNSSSKKIIDKSKIHTKSP